MSKSLPVLSEALYYHQCGRLAEATVMFRQVIKQEPNNHLALHALGILYLQEKRVDKALAMVEEAISLQPKQHDYYVTLGTIFEALADYTRAAEAYRTALYINPMIVDSLEGLARLSARNGEYFKAIDYYRDVLEQNPYASYLEFELAECLYAAGIVEEATDRYHRAHLLQPYSLNIMLVYSQVLLRSFRYDDCAEVLAHGREYFPLDGRLIYLQALVDFKQDEFDDALLKFEKALEFINNDKQVLLDYAICLRAVGDDISAERVLMKIEELGS